MSTRTRVIAVFAHNEAKNIIAALESVKANVRRGDRCFVLNNGSTDSTARLVQEYQRDNDFCSLEEIVVGDKCNAWNHFIHDLTVDSSIYCFLDGDCRMQRGALDALEKSLSSNPYANAAAGLPADGVGDKNRRQMREEGGLAGNLYALRREFVSRIRQNAIRLPVGFVGDDSLVGALAYWDLDPYGEWDRSKIILCEGARFEYSPLSLFSYHDLRLYYRRKIRYSARRFQINLLRPRLKERGLAGIPPRVDDLYESRAVGALRWRGLDTWFDWRALRSLRR